jgi:ribonuclease HI
VEELLAGKGLDDLAPEGDAAREEVRRLLRRFLPRTPSASLRAPVSGSTPRAILRCDGASRGNPGPAAIGVVLSDASGETIESFGRSIGTATNNVAEYRAVAAGLEAARRHGIEALELRLDSELVVRQLNGQYKVRHPALAELKDDVDRLLAAFRSVRVLHVPREENRDADRLANQALDRDAEAARE